MENDLPSWAAEIRKDLEQCLVLSDERKVIGYSKVPDLKLTEQILFLLDEVVKGGS